jgi:hypothetical protein
MEIATGASGGDEGLAASPPHSPCALPPAPPTLAPLPPLPPGLPHTAVGLVAPPAG